jgi:hypothetical protein
MIHHDYWYLLASNQQLPPMSNIIGAPNSVNLFTAEESSKGAGSLESPAEANIIESVP